MRADQFTEDPTVRCIVNRTREAFDDKSISDIRDGKGHQYVELVMAGGGVLGIALVGFAYVLEEVGLRFLRLGGASAGSINALLLAALGSPDEAKSLKVIQHLASMNMFDFVDGGPAAKFFVSKLVHVADQSGPVGKLLLAPEPDAGDPGILTKPFELFGYAIDTLDLGIRTCPVWMSLEQHLGLNPGTAFRKWLSDALRSAGIATHRDLMARMNKMPEGLQRVDGHPLTREESEPALKIVALDLITQTKVEFPLMGPLFWAEPDEVDPALYVRASMSIPGFFYPFQIAPLPSDEQAHGRWKELAHYDKTLPSRAMFVDGGVVSNFPVNLFHRDGVPLMPTIGASLSFDERRLQNITDPLSLLAAIFNSARHTLDYDFLYQHPYYDMLVAHIDTGPHNWLNFNLKEPDKIDLFRRGAAAAEKFLREFNWEAYKEIRKNPKP